MTTVASSPITRSTPLRVAAAAGVGCAALALWNPGDGGADICPTRALLGIDCPLCGGTRAVASLGRGDLVGAADHNLLVVVVVPLLLAWWAAWWWADRHGRPAPRRRFGTATWVAIASVALAFAVVRNLPVGGVSDWLASTRS